MLIDSRINTEVYYNNLSISLLSPTDDKLILSYSSLITRYDTQHFVTDGYTASPKLGMCKHMSERPTPHVFFTDTVHFRQVINVVDR